MISRHYWQLVRAITYIAALLALPNVTLADGPNEYQEKICRLIQEKTGSTESVEKFFSSLNKKIDAAYKLSRRKANVRSRREEAIELAPVSPSQFTEVGQFGGVPSGNVTFRDRRNTEPTSYKTIWTVSKVLYTPLNQHPRAASRPGDPVVARSFATFQPCVIFGDFPKNMTAASGPSKKYIPQPSIWYVVDFEDHVTENDVAVKIPVLVLIDMNKWK